MKKLLFFLVLILYFTGCYSGKYVKKGIQKNYYEAIKEYVDSNKDYNQFLLIPADKFYTIQGKIDGYLLGPLYPIVLDLMETNVLELERFPSNQIVYYTSDFNGFFNEKDFSFENIRDSVFIYGSYNRNPLINFLKRSVLLNINENNPINYQPDTLYLPVYGGVDTLYAPECTKKVKRNRAVITEIPEL